MARRRNALPVPRRGPLKGQWRIKVLLSALSGTDSSVNAFDSAPVIHCAIWYGRGAVDGLPQIGKRGKHVH